MKRLNKSAALLMHKYKAHAATDITGFGILGHARNLGAAQDANIFLELNCIPVMMGAIKASRLIEDKYKLFQGLSAETSGGLLVALPSIEAALAYLNELRVMDDVSDGWVVGQARARVPEDSEYAALVNDARFIDV